MTPKCRPEQRRNFWPRIPISTQAKDTSQIPRKRAKRKKESIRKGALLPDAVSYTHLTLPTILLV